MLRTRDWPKGESSSPKINHEMVANSQVRVQDFKYVKNESRFRTQENSISDTDVEFFGVIQN